MGETVSSDKKKNGSGLKIVATRGWSSTNAIGEENAQETPRPREIKKGRPQDPKQREIK